MSTPTPLSAYQKRLVASETRRIRTWDTGEPCDRPAFSERRNGIDGSGVALALILSVLIWAGIAAAYYYGG